jgi:acetyl esterase/lipase
MTGRLRADDLHPDLRATIRYLPNPPIRFRWGLALLQAASRVRKPWRIPAGMQHRYVDLGNGAGVHVLAPTGDRIRPALLWIHGGGLVIGSAAQDHPRCLGWARTLDLVVVSVEHRLAPAHPYPAALDDCQAAWRWTLAHADELGIDPERIAIGGQSAGGGLAAALAQRIADAGGQQPAAQWLFCPMLDDRTAADRQLDDVGHYVWNNTSNRVGWSAYLAGPPGREGIPSDASPARRADLRGLPPAWIGTGSIELFHDEDRRYAERLTDAGVPCVLDTVPGGPHGFESVLPGAPVTRAYMGRATAWLGGRLRPAATGGLT